MSRVIPDGVNLQSYLSASSLINHCGFTFGLPEKDIPDDPRNNHNRVGKGS